MKAEKRRMVQGIQSFSVEARNRLILVQFNSKVWRKKRKEGFEHLVLNNKIK